MKKNSFIQDLLDTKFDVDKVTAELDGYVTIAEGIVGQMETLVENYDTEGMNSQGASKSDPSSDHWAQLSQKLDVLMRQFDAAKRGLSIVSRLTPGPDRAKHASRVMSNMNKIRGGMRRAEKALKMLSADSSEDVKTELEAM